MAIFRVTASIEYSYVTEWDEADVTEEDVAESEYDAFIPEEFEAKIVQYQILEAPKCDSCRASSNEFEAKFCVVCGSKVTPATPVLVER